MYGHTSLWQYRKLPSSMDFRISCAVPELKPSTNSISERFPTCVGNQVGQQRNNRPPDCMSRWSNGTPQNLSERSGGGLFSKPSILVNPSSSRSIDFTHLVSLSSMTTP